MRVAAAVGAWVVLALADTLYAQTAQPLLAADERVRDTERAACDVLKAYAGAALLPRKKPERGWSCDFTSFDSRYVRVIGLRSNARNLVGWYAVARRGHAVFEWDVGNWRLLAADSRRPTVDDSPSAACHLAKERVAALVAAAPSAEWRCEFEMPGDDLFYFPTLWGIPPGDTAAVRLGVFAVGRRGDLVAGLEESTKRVISLRVH
jgi:hypothetical protein